MATIFGALARWRRTPIEGVESLLVLPEGHPDSSGIPLRELKVIGSPLLDPIHYMNPIEGVESAAIWLSWPDISSMNPIEGVESRR